MKLVRAYHRNGTFQRPEVEDVAAQIKMWEERNQTDLRKLAALIKKILDVVKESGGSASVKYEVKKDRLVISRVYSGKKMLPEDLYSKWDDKDISEKPGSSTEHDTGPESAVESVGDEVEHKAEGEKGTISSPGGVKKDEKAAEAAKQGEQALPDDLLSNLTLAKKKDSGPQDEGEGYSGC